MPRAASVIAWTLLGLVVGCGGGSAANDSPTVVAPPPARPSGPVRARGEGDVTAVVGSDGGELTLSSGFTFEIPAGALSEPVEITLRVGTDASAFRNREDERAIGQPVRITPELTAAPGTKFVLSVPFTSLPDGFEERDVAIAVERPQGEQREGVMDSLVSTRWDHDDASVASGHVRAELSQLPGFRVQFVASR